MPFQMEHVSPQADAVLSLALYTAVATLLVGFLLLVAWWLGSKRRTVVKQKPYESGIFPTGTARLAYPVPFYLVAIFFIVFDVEAVFIFTWGMAWDELGFPGLVHITIFIVILLLGLAWLWLKGGLEWGPRKAVRGSKFEVPD
ncbi:NADH dehydrogenase I, A subunit [Geotalea daltonii FRC-32]|uniref:NADH-quinone oxidoreductase subunit A n=1 Tax=Geotalea daltonii (strain DSM 22248 / JCM 15807 / FRC-32) TaxID=316067 RepID=B9M3X9_GEODF|nr:NADH-quinone oxidoreductase subunit A [Geotalea daltonii]ACM19622.1 NADH dehydrogenase I, A subunit [Geotalea daltonii FRC-32]